MWQAPPHSLLRASTLLVWSGPLLCALQWWPGGLGKVSTHAILYARLLLPRKGASGGVEDQGIHGMPHRHLHDALACCALPLSTLSVSLPLYSYWPLYSLQRASPALGSPSCALPLPILPLPAQPSWSPCAAWRTTGPCPE